MPADFCLAGQKIHSPIHTRRDIKQALREFCLLRAESVSGQLDGSIPSTSEEQKLDGSALIDGSAINMSDTGSMNGGAPNGGQNDPGHRDAPWDDRGQEDRPVQPPERENPPDTPQELPAAGDTQSAGVRVIADSPALYNGQDSGSPQALEQDNTPPDGENNSQPEKDANRPGGNPGPWNPPEGEPSGDDGDDYSGHILALTVSAVVLGFGLGFAWLFKRK